MLKDNLSIPANVIYLKQDKGRWYTLSDIPPAALNILGSNALPTKFRSFIKAETVYQYIQESNPDKFVMVIA